MNHIVALNLSLILLLPWYLVLGIVYWRTRRKPASAAQRGIDVASLLLALAAAALGGYWSFGQADPQAGAIWKQVLGVDREAEWVDLATARAREAGLADRCRYQRGDATSLPFRDGTFDLVTCQTVLIHLPDPEQGLREMLRVARPGGLVLAVEPSNFANSAVLHSVSDTMPSEEIIDVLRFELV